MLLQMVTGDEVHGQDPQLRSALEARGIGYVLAAACTTKVRINENRRWSRPPPWPFHPPRLPSPARQNTRIGCLVRRAAARRAGYSTPSLAPAPKLGRAPARLAARSRWMPVRPGLLVEDSHASVVRAGALMVCGKGISAVIAAGGSTVSGSAGAARRT